MPASDRPRRRARPPPTPRSMPGSSSSPTIPCVIRIARSEMGQGTRTGLAQLVAEELECDWRKVTTDSITPGQNLARKRVWGEMGTGGSRGIRTSQDYVRRGGAAARMMLLQAAADQWQVPVSEVTVADGVITHAASKRSTTYGKVAAAAAGLDGAGPEEHHAQGSEGLEDCRQAAEAAGHGGQAERQPGLCDRRRAAGHAARRDQGVPGVRRHARELRRGEDRGDARRTPRRQGQRHDGRGRRRYLVEGQAGARRAADRLGRGRRRLAVERDDRGASQGGPDGDGHERLTSERRRAQGDRGRRKKGRGGLQHAVPRPRDHGADELHRQDLGRQGRGVGADPELGGLAGRPVGGLGIAAGEMRGLPARPRRRIRTARRRAGLRAPGGAPSPSSFRVSRSR